MELRDAFIFFLLSAFQFFARLDASRLFMCHP